MKPREWALLALIGGLVVWQLVTPRRCPACLAPRHPGEKCDWTKETTP